MNCFLLYILFPTKAGYRRQSNTFGQVPVEALVESLVVVTSETRNYPRPHGGVSTVTSQQGVGFDSQVGQTPVHVEMPAVPMSVQVLSQLVSGESKQEWQEAGWEDLNLQVLLLYAEWQSRRAANELNVLRDKMLTTDVSVSSANQPLLQLKVNLWFLQQKLQTKDAQFICTAYISAL